MMLMMIINGVLAIARRLLSVSKPISVQQHLLTSGARVHLRRYKANAIEAMSNTESHAVTRHRSLENQHVTNDTSIVCYSLHRASSEMYTWIRC